MSTLHPVQHVYVCRHGSYRDDTRDRDPPLTATGVSQGRVIAKRMHELTPDLPATILSSSALRASEFADVIAQTFSLEAKKDACFWHDAYNTPDEKRCLSLMQEVTTPVLIVVSHKDFITGLIAGFGNIAFGKRHFPKEPDYGQGWYVTLGAVPMKIPN